MTESRPTLYLFDWLILSYCLLMTIALLAFGQPMGEHRDGLLTYLALGLVSLVVIFTTRTDGPRWMAWIRLGYPAVLATMFYRVTGGHMYLLFDSFLDWQVVTFERMLLGVNPTLYIDQHLLNVVVTEILSLCYFCYYPMLPGFLLLVLIRGDHEVAREYLAAASITFFLSYLLFWLYPVEGPRWHFADQYVNPVTGPVFRSWVDTVMQSAAVRGGAMPSSHTGVALVTLFFCRRYYKKLGYILLPIVIGLALGTVWGRFHYASDVVIGAALGIFGTGLVWKYASATKAGVEKSESGSNEVRTQNVS